MNPAYVRLICPSCGDDWQENPNQLPAHDEEFTCSKCDAERRMAEFMRTSRDLEILKQLH